MVVLPVPGNPANTMSIGDSPGVVGVHFVDEPVCSVFRVLCWFMITSPPMSSDTFYINVLYVEGDEVEFLCSTSTAGGINDYAMTRSFAIMLIEDGMPYASEGKGTPLQLELRKLAGTDTPPVWEEKFHKEHVAKFITKATLLGRIGIVKDEDAWKHGRFEEQNEDDFPLHKFILHVQVTDPKWLEGLEPGSRYGTTAFDAWWDDPTRQSERELAEIERKATTWKPPRKKTAKKNDATEPATAKKTTARKTAVKKNAV